MKGLRHWTEPLPACWETTSRELARKTGLIEASITAGKCKHFRQPGTEGEFATLQVDLGQLGGRQKALVQAQI
jgi:hypothetical protein